MELKVEREYRVKVFNGFINAWFDHRFWQVNESYDYAYMIKEIFGFFYITIFQKKHKIKQSQDQSDFLINGENK